MELMLTLENHRVAFHFLETNHTIFSLFFVLISELHFLCQQDQQQAGTNLSGQFLVNVVSLKEGVGHSNENEVGAGQEEYKFVEEDGLACAVPDELEDKHKRDSPLEDENGDESDGLIVVDMPHGPVKERGTDHAQGRKTEIDRHQDDDLDVGEKLQSELEFEHGSKFQIDYIFIQQPLGLSSVLEVIFFYISFVKQKLCNSVTWAIFNI